MEGTLRRILVKRARRVRELGSFTDDSARMMTEGLA
jgi:hypothetical protein